MIRTWLALDQWGNKYVFNATHPRRKLMAKHGVRSAREIYVDPGARYIGWIVAGHWYRVYLLTPLSEVKI
jgi:hypothetical protein